MTKKQANALPPKGRLEYFGSRLEMYLGLIKRGAKLEFPNANRCRKWGIKVAHAVYELHPELREENSLERYFVAKAGRKLGLRGDDLSQFVERSYSDGTARGFIQEKMKVGIQ